MSCWIQCPACAAGGAAPEPLRQFVGYVVRKGKVRGKGKYLWLRGGSHDVVWIPRPKDLEVIMWSMEEFAGGAAVTHGGRVVRIVRKAVAT